MKQSEVGKSTMANLLKGYAAAATAHYRATTQSDFQTANDQHDVIALIYREIRRRGREAQSLLLGILDHPDEGVRLWAGAHALEFAPEEGEPILKALSNRPDICGMTASATLEEWKKGTLIFP